MANFHTRFKALSRSTRNTVAALAYRAGVCLYDEKTGQTFDYSHKDVQHVEWILPSDAPQWAVDLKDLIQKDRQAGVQEFSNKVEAAEKRCDARVYREFEFSLPAELTDEQNKALAFEFATDQIAGRGMSVILNFHFDVDKVTGQRKPHCHAMILTRELTEDGFCKIKNREWNKKELATILRESLADYMNYYLQLFGHQSRVTADSFEKQGIDLLSPKKISRKADRVENVATDQLKAQKQNTQSQSSSDDMGLVNSDEEHHQGEATNGSEATNKEEVSGDKSSNRFKKDSIESNRGSDFSREDKFITVKAKESAFIKLSNMYKVMSNPDVILDVLTRENCTFNVGDIDDVISRHIDDQDIFKIVRQKVLESKNLVLLKPAESYKTESGKVMVVPDVYTTRKNIEKELGFIEKIDVLSGKKSHVVPQKIIEKHINAFNEKFKREDGTGGLSSDQIESIRYFTSGEQLSCVIGFAGTGKTTSVEACKNIWEESGFKVYGLAPTNKAMKKLMGAGIKSTTVSKFLHEFKSGRCQYNKKSILVVDESSMISLDNFDNLLGAAQKLGIKIVTLGDNYQLPSIDSGPAYKIMTNRIKTVVLETVLRQKVEWQAEATQYFGRGETRAALELYDHNGNIKLISEDVPILKELEIQKDFRGMVEAYNISVQRIASIKRFFVNDKHYSLSVIDSKFLNARKREWEQYQKIAAHQIKENLDNCRSHMKDLRVDDIKFASLFLEEKDKKNYPNEKVAAFFWAKSNKLPKIEGEGQKHLCQQRSRTTDALLSDWHAAKMANPDKIHLIMAYTNYELDVLNDRARSLMQKERLVEKKSYEFTIEKEITDDFDNKIIISRQKEFSVGDRLQMNKKIRELNVDNGDLGTILEISKNKITVKFDNMDKPVSFAPSLYKRFNHGYAVTIHKAQGDTTSSAFVLGSDLFNDKLSAVAFTRHEKNVRLYASQLEFPKKEMLLRSLEKPHEKLSAMECVLTESKNINFLSKAKEDAIWDKTYKKISNHLSAMSYMAKRSIDILDDKYFRGDNLEQAQAMRLDKSVWESERQQLLAKEKLKEFINQNKEENKEAINPESEIKENDSRLAAKTSAIASNQASDSTVSDKLQNANDTPKNDSAKSTHITVNKETTRVENFEIKNTEQGIVQEKSTSKISEATLTTNNASNNATSENASKNIDVQVNSLKNENPIKESDIDVSKTAVSDNSYDVQNTEKCVNKEKVETIKPETTSNKVIENETNNIDPNTRLFNQSKPIQGTAGERYLNNILGDKVLCDFPSDIRFIEDRKINKSKCDAILCFLRNQSGELVGYTEILLQKSKPEEKVVKKLTDSYNPERTYGETKTSFLKVQEGWGRTFIVEGIEPALALKASGVTGEIVSVNKLTSFKYLEVKNETVILCPRSNKITVQTTEPKTNKLSKSNHFKEPSITYQEIADRLRSNIDQLATSIMGKPSSHTSKEMRFGKKGSISVKISGDMCGMYSNFESGVKGDPITLIKDQLGLDRKDAINWAKNWLNLPRDVSSTRVESVKKPSKEKDNSWKILSIVPDSAPKPDVLNNRYLSGMCIGKTLIDTYEYRHVNGKLAHYVYRLEDSDGNKITPPLYYKENKDGKQYWGWGGVSPDSAGNPLYGAHLLSIQKPVLIVEGEKTTNAARKLLPEYTVISWKGGSGSFDKSDWTVLVGKNVTIWADHDDPGYKVANNIAAKLNGLNKEAGYKDLVKQVVVPENTPKKWDLADKIPSCWTTNINDLLANAVVNDAQPIAKKTYTKSSVNVLEDINILKQEREILQEKGYTVAIINESLNDLLSKQGPENLKELIEEKTPKTNLERRQEFTDLVKETDNDAKLDEARDQKLAALQEKYSARNEIKQQELQNQSHRSSGLEI